MALHGFRKLLGINFVDMVQPPHLYRPQADMSSEAATEAQAGLYGRGFTFSHWLIDDHRIDRSDLLAKIQHYHFDLIVYGSVHRGLPLLHEVLAMEALPVVFLDGEDQHQWCNASSTLRKFGTFFMREIPQGCPHA